METNIDNNIAYVRIEDPEKFQQILNAVFNRKEPDVIPEPQLAYRRPVDNLDFQMLNATAHWLNQFATERVNEDETTYQSVIDDASRKKGNEVIRAVMDRFLDEIKHRG